MNDTDATTCDNVLGSDSSPDAPRSLPLTRRLDRILAALQPTPAEASVRAARRQRRLDGELLAAAQRADLEAVAAVLAQGADANAIRRRYRTVFGLGAVADAHDSALILAMKSRQPAAIDVALRLLEHGADPAYVNRHGETASSFLGRMRGAVVDVFGEADASVKWQWLVGRLER